MAGSVNSLTLLPFLSLNSCKPSCTIDQSQTTSNNRSRQSKRSALVVKVRLLLLFSRDVLRSIGTQDPFKLFLDLEQIKKKWFYAQDTRQISKRKKFAQYVLDTRTIFPH
jgi:hypothetical protein